MRLPIIITAFGIAASGCAIQKISPPGVVLTRPVMVAPRNVLVFNSLADVPGRHALVEEVWIRDDGTLSPREMASQLRVMAGARGANAIVMSSTNRRDNGTRIDLKVRFDNPFDYYSATAIWIGEGPRPETYLGTLGGKN